ncbi:MAG: tetratricopeptide repeat protein [Magnetospirillum sp.]|nr:tetratricopeptide repeat protein [Magnetospirillum sp.]
MAALVREGPRVTPNALLREGLAAHAQGRVEAAIAAFARAAAAAPDLADAQYLLGAALSGAGRDAQARAPLERAVALAPDVGAYRAALALCLKGLGLIEAARDAFDAARALAPRDAEIAFNRANALAGEAAITAYGETLAIDPGHAGARLNRANALARAGRWSAAAEDYRALPEDPRALIGLAGAYLRCGEPALARDAAAEAVRRAPDAGEAWLNLGAALGMLGQVDAALAALACAPVSVAATVARAVALSRAGRDAEAMAALDAAPERDFDVCMARGNAAFALDRAADAEAAFAAAMALRPDDAAAMANFANVRLYRGHAAQAVDLLHQARARAPADPGVAAAALYALSYDDRTTAAASLAAHRAWGAAWPVRPRPSRATMRARPRIGYVSADFRAHSCAWVLRAVLPHHDRARFEIHAFANLAVADATTRALATNFDGWHDVAALHDDAAADLIRATDVDLLIDLSGHTAGNRLGVFARRPAHLQATWLGYPATTGLPAMDARIVDAVSDPDDAGMTEAPVRVPGGFLAYAPPAADLPAARAREAGPVFGSFNNLAKLSPATLALWARLLRETPEATLALKARSLADPAVRAEIAARFEALGVAPDRVRTQGFAPEPLGPYAAIDVALDPLPYNGTITSFEALWMGVPLVTSPGSTHAARVGASILTHAGFADWIAADADAYVAVARKLAAERPDRAALRARLAASPACDGARIARAIEALATAGP